MSKNLQAENQVLRHEAQEYEAALAEAAQTIGDLVAKLEAAKRQIKELEARLPKPKAALPEHMVKARALAMSTGKTVLA